MGQELSGLIKQWSDEKGFGFIKGDNGIDVFFHISSLRGSRRPKMGDNVFYIQKKFAGQMGCRTCSPFGTNNG